MTRATTPVVGVSCDSATLCSLLRRVGLPDALRPIAAHDVLQGVTLAMLYKCTPELGVETEDFRTSIPLETDDFLSDDAWRPRTRSRPAICPSSPARPVP